MSLRFVGCNCPVGMKYHALNCPDRPGRPQNIPVWLKPKSTAAAAGLVEHRDGG